MFVRTHVAQQIAGVPPAEVFEYATDAASISAYFRGYGLVPSIRRVTLAGPTGVGAHRRLEMSDGSLLDEEVLELVPPSRQRYRVRGFRAPLRWLARYGEGEWRLAARDGGTRVDWSYQFAVTTPLVWPLVWPLVSLFMRGSMRRTLAALAEHFA